MSYLKEMYGEQSKDFCQGMIEGFKTYAHWKDGVQYVGTTGKTLKDAIKEVDEIKGYNE